MVVFLTIGTFQTVMQLNFRMSVQDIVSNPIRKQDHIRFGPRDQILINHVTTSPPLYGRKKHLSIPENEFKIFANKSERKKGVSQGITCYS